MCRANKGFTLTEIVVVVLIFGIGVGLFNTIFINNWSAYEDRIARANLWNQANQFLEELSLEARNSKTIEVTATASNKSIILTNAGDDSVVTTFTLTDTGTLSRLKNETTKVFSTQAVFSKSAFTKGTKNLNVDLQLSDTVLGRIIHINASTEVLLRN